MSRVVRGAVALLFAALVGLVGALPSSAADPEPTDLPTQQFGCLNPVDQYGAPQVCQLLVRILTPICDNEVPKLRYQVEAVGSPNTVVKVTFVNPSGPDVVYADQPLSGTVNWPGAVVGPDGRGIDWPGWTQLPDGTWVEHDEFDWVRPSVEVKFEVNPEADVAVAYPPSSPVCNTNPPDEVLGVAAGGLSATGSEAGPLMLAGGALVVVGGATVALVTRARRRHSAATQG